MLRVMNTIIMFSSKFLMQIKLRTETSFSKFVELCIYPLEVVEEKCAAKEGFSFFFLRLFGRNDDELFARFFKNRS